LNHVPLNFIDIYRYLDLEPLDGLRIMRLPRINCNSPYLDSRGTAQATFFLDKLTSPCIEVVYLSVELRSVGQLEHIDWEKISRICARPNFSGLKRLSLLLDPCGSSVDRSELLKQTLSWLAKRLPACRARGLFRVKITRN
jgi:hypothetical protein